MADDKYKFSAGKVVAIVTLVYAIAFGLIIDHGISMIHHHAQNASHTS
jgi:hypothetical protein